MQFLIFLLIALGWLGWSVAWMRDRQFGGNMLGGLSTPRISPRLASPRSVSMARRRRRELLAVLASLALVTFVLARAWSLLWAAHVLVDLALVGYAFAVVSLERPQTIARMTSTFGAVPLDTVDDTAEYLAS